MGWQDAPLVNQPEEQQPLWMSAPKVDQKAPAVPAVRGDYRDQYAGKNLAQGNLDYLKDYLSGIGKAATTEQPQDMSTQSPMGTTAGIGEAALHLGSSALAPLFALPDWAITKMGMADPRNPSGTYAGAREKYVYEPRTSVGKQASGVAGAALKPVGDVFSLIGSGYGGMAGLAGASPEAQKEIQDIAPDVVSAGLSIGGLRGGAAKPTEKPAIPTTADLRQAKTAAYKAGNASEALTTPEANAAAIAKIDEALRSENLVVDKDLHPKSSALLRRLNEQKDQPLTVPEAESLRQLALEVQRDVDPVTRQPTADSYRAGVILDELDNSLDTLSVNKPARELNARFRRSQLIDEMIHRAEIKAGAHYTQAGMEHALRQEFKQLALNPRRMRGLTMEQKAAIEKVAKGGPVENSLRVLGKFDPTQGGMATLVSLGSGGLASAIAGPLGLALPPAGFIGRRMATRMTKNNVERAREALVGRAPAAAPQIPVAQPAAMSGELMQRPPLALPAPNIIAGSRSAPGTAYAREQMGMTPDVERAGALHPGMARESTLPPAQPLALPYRPAVKQPMVVDPQGRAAADPAQIDAYLREMGMNNMNNVRQPRAEPTPSGLLGAEPEPQPRGLLGSSTRSAGQIRRDLQKLDQKIQRLPVGEPLNSPRMKALAKEWERLRAELSAAESSGASP